MTVVYNNSLTHHLNGGIDQGIVIKHNILGSLWEN